MLVSLTLITSMLVSEFPASLIFRALTNFFLPPSQNLVKLNNSSDSDLLLGKFSLNSTDNFDNYLAELGVSYILRQLAQLASPIVTISRTCPDLRNTTSSHINTSIFNDDCFWKINTDTAFKVHSVTFKLGQPVDDTTMDGRSIQSLITRPAWDRLDETQTGDVTTHISRTFTKTAMKLNLRVNQVTATSTFIRQIV